MNILLVTFAWISMVLSITTVLLTPLVIGRPKTGVWNYGDFIGKVTGAIVVCMLAMRVLGWI